MVLMAEIVLTTLNAKYIHAAFGLRYLLANLGPLRSRACLVEFDVNQRPVDIVEVLLARNPRLCRGVNRNRRRSGKRQRRAPKVCRRLCFFHNVGARID